MTRCKLLAYTRLTLLLLPSMVCAQQSPVDLWATLLKPHHFPQTELIEDNSVIELVTPYRAEDAATTPVRIKALLPQSAERYIKTVYLFVDRNPEPLVGRFEFTPNLPRADLALRVRVDRYTDVRAVAVLNTGEHHMVSNFVKAAGGCTAPMATDYKLALATMGEMQLKTLVTPSDHERIAQLLVRHPNTTGMQMDYKIYAVRPAHYVKTIRVLLDGVVVMSAETGISVSEDPSFRFFLPTQAHGELTAEVTDSNGTQWRETLKLAVLDKTPK
ncbi:MAG: quinoprotein dehydrogenase-associated SoxYZ-like carrier [Gammaproteobacteria bacterium]|nr:quinoprotein dehydrogenase-associated SoxYZ-like carrier [Gammaproteobacteria bacterium]